MRCMILSSNSQRVEKVFSPRWASFQNFIKVLKTCSAGRKDFFGTLKQGARGALLYFILPRR